MEQSLILKQTQNLSLRQLQSLKILACTNQELDTLLTQEYLENPLLDCSIDKQTDMFRSIEQLVEQGTTYAEHYSVFEDSDVDRRGDVASRDHAQLSRAIKGQLHAADYSPQAWKLIDDLIQCLDEKGFFPYAPQTIARVLQVPEQLVADCLRDLKQLEPVGIFSADISECLLAQLQRQGIEDPLLFTLITDYMPEILQGRLADITRALHIPTARLKEYLHRIGRLNPRPFMNIENDEVHYIVPDVLAAYDGERFTASLNDSWIGEYRYDSYYLRLMKSTKDKELSAYFREKLGRARMVIDAVESRRKTLTRVSEVILERQRDFFLTGAPLVPMTLQDVAAESDVHLSTVSRAVQGKYIQFRRPVLMKSLFQREVSDALSPDEIERHLRRLIAAENPLHPFSDEALRRALLSEGFDIPRRTIAKYRIQLNIPDSRSRKQ